MLWRHLVSLYLFCRIEGEFQGKREGFQKTHCKDVMNLGVPWGRCEQEEQEAKERGLPESARGAAFSLLAEKETGFRRKQTT